MTTRGGRRRSRKRKVVDYAEEVDVAALHEVKPKKTPSAAHYMAYCDDEEDITSIMRKFQALEDLKAEQKKENESVQDEEDDVKRAGKRAAASDADVSMVDEHEECERLAKRMKVEVPTISREEEDALLRLEKRASVMGYTLDDGLDASTLLSGQYEQIHDYKPAVDGYERELLMKKLVPSLKGGCQPDEKGDMQCYKPGAMALLSTASKGGTGGGVSTSSNSLPKSASENAAAARESSPTRRDLLKRGFSCRKLAMECGPSCACAKSIDRCLNRGVQRRQHKVLGRDVVEVQLKGIDSYTRGCVHAGLQSLSDAAKDYFIDRMLLPTLRQRCVRKDAEGTLVGAIEELASGESEFLPPPAALPSDTPETSASSNSNSSSASSSNSSAESEKKSSSSSSESKANSDSNSSRKDAPATREEFVAAAKHLDGIARRSPKDFQSHPKGICVVMKDGMKIGEHEFIGEYFGELYPAWRWYERERTLKKVKQSLQDSGTILPDFYNMVLERQPHDARGYDLVFVDPKKCGSFTSRFSHSCDPNAQVSIVGSGDRYTIAVHALRPIHPGEEITFDYMCRTDSKEEADVAVCLCGQKYCRGNYLKFSDEQTDGVLHQHHSFLHRMFIVACAADGKLNSEQQRMLEKFNIRSSLLDGLPPWGKKFAALVCDFIERETKLLPHELYENSTSYIPSVVSVENKDDDSAAKDGDSNRSPVSKKTYPKGIHADRMRYAEEEADIVRNKRVQCLAISIDRIKYFLRNRGQPKKAPLRVLARREVAQRLWFKKSSVVKSFERAVNPFLDYQERKKMRSITGDPQLRSDSILASSKEQLKRIREKMLALRDFLRTLTPTKGASHYAAADLIHLYASTKMFLHMEEYQAFKSAYAEVGVCVDGSGRGIVEHCAYPTDYVLMQLDAWHNETPEPKPVRFQNALRGALLLPDIDSCYASEGGNASGCLSHSYTQYEREWVLDSLRVGWLVPEEERKEASVSWPKGIHFKYKNNAGLVGSPIFDELFGKSTRKKCFEALSSWDPFE